ncbi:helicase, RecD/TraA family (plasmid) [Deinococcus proteolyticus MRP]|uniref:ATP-dependent RecD2 DNA helicase n=1 Tax=Deinococcus proteolyticus (strain ATCC 35074 / DSM 20540 / JCM 6276 / NBRC 101906 / NCIMB 13154 / VKM Ac-1939 / CCM 2703 / MRP) TaxID=693977 RepID=F0RQB6_DEIPM|nr:ATP-dependent RecD-like DNA helicase [Deinococcus proteolyticus]ADY27475.1 helicase, RecD/TraA family [Deinococcus proteolyticus MRP]
MTQTFKANGTVVQVRYVSDDKEYCVITADLIIEGVAIPDATVVGHMPVIDVYDGFEAELTKEKNARWGYQYRALRLTPTGKPGQLDRGSIAAFFQYNFKGIGPKIGKALADEFGNGVFDLLDKDPEKLLSIKGITRTVYAGITEGWKSYRAAHLNIIGLQQLGLSPRLANRVQHHLGHTALEQLEVDMYTLMRVEGIGFGMADRLALERGYAANDPRRLSAAARHALETAEQSQGHTYLPHSRVIGGIQHFTGCTEQEAEAALTMTTDAGHIISETYEGEERALYLKSTWKQEVELAKHITELLSTPPQSNWSIPADIGKHLSEEQRAALELPANHRLCILTGGPGTGKTTTVGAMLKVAHHSRLSVALAAPTGKAAKRLEETTGQEAVTIHRLLGSTGKDFYHNEHCPLNVDVLIVDETSMMGQSLSYHLLAATGRGTRVILLGDAAQLPPVEAGEPLNNLLHLVPTATLTQVFRQAAKNPIISAAHALQSGQAPDFPENAAPANHLLNHTEARAERLPDVVCQLVASLGGPSKAQILAPMKKGPAGTEALNEAMQAHFNPARGRQEITIAGSTCRSGDPVVQTRNNYDLGIFNGMIGEVIEVKDKEMKVIFDGEVITIKGKEAFDLQLAYALTIHRSQGSEWPVVIGVLSDVHGRMLTRNLAYTALTRAKESFHSAGQRHAWTRAAGQQQLKRLTKLRTRVERNLAPDQPDLQAP